MSSTGGTDRELPRLVFPVGFHPFHRKAFINYQLNRAHALGWVEAPEVTTLARAIRTPEDCVRVFDEASVEAEGQDRVREAIGYARMAEFFASRAAPEQRTRYLRYRQLFDRFTESTAIVRHDVPFGGATLPAYRLPATTRRMGAVVVHGGFDSLIEEFLGIWERLAAGGFDVIAFDGPGQGGARRLGGLTFDHDWEKPVAVILDHFEEASVDLVGLSMGGYWALRAASREPRVERVVSWPPVYDWLLRIPTLVRRPARMMLRRRRFMRWSVRTRAKLIPTLRLVVDQALYNAGSQDPADVVDWFLGMNPDHLGSERITQPVLLLSGENDTFQPPHLATAQARALTAATSVTHRRFTADEHADRHCQMGNLDLACQVVTEWLREARSQHR